MNNRKIFINFGFVLLVIRFIGKEDNIEKLKDNLKIIIEILINSKY